MSKNNNVVAETEGVPFVIVRTLNAGVFFGYLATPEGTDVVLIGVRRCWRWSGAVTLSQMAMEGVKNPNDCKFDRPAIRIHVYGVIEILSVTEEAKNNLCNVPVWEA